MTSNLQLVTGTVSPQPSASEHQVVRMAASLVTTFHIQPGKSLVMILGNGMEDTNREAIITWTRATLAREGLSPSKEAFERLALLLKRELVEIDPGMAE
ncbi:MULTISPECIES: hypothetical protein [Halomonadaceae]|jgi:hypothetical protein|uniref:Uncharacterized protein n=1 Tax=Vreelandella halophila TaxID=86177 RepID=A0A9X4YDN7_9GAMM|nr:MULTISPECIES: hypothetical protein [Halomonas]MYL27556.1 hypothetical protein [Halomonas utahensis]MYL74682.1 hypothetical protein [Halomonas sp. 22501_18_FS]